MKTALVTGGAKRIGEAIVRELANSGYGVAIHCNASRAEADALAAELAAGGAGQPSWREISSIRRSARRWSGGRRRNWVR